MTHSVLRNNGGYLAYCVPVESCVNNYKQTGSDGKADPAFRNMLEYAKCGKFVVKRGNTGRIPLANR